MRILVVVALVYTHACTHVYADVYTQLAPETCAFCIPMHMSMHMSIYTHVYTHVYTHWKNTPVHMSITDPRLDMCADMCVGVPEDVRVLVVAALGLGERLDGVADVPYHRVCVDGFFFPILF